MPSDDVAEFGGWPRPPQWVWAVAGVVAAAVLAGVVIAHTRSHHAAAAWRSKSPAAAPAPLRGPPYQPGGLRPGGPRPRARADRPPTCHKSAWPSNTPLLM